MNLSARSSGDSLVLFSNRLYDQVLQTAENWLEYNSPYSDCPLAIDELEETYPSSFYEQLFEYAIYSEIEREGYDFEDENLPDAIYENNRMYLIDTWHSRIDAFYKDIIDILVTQRYFVIFNNFNQSEVAIYNSPLQNIW